MKMASVILLLVLLLLPGSPAIAQSVAPGAFSGSWVARNQNFDADVVPGEYQGFPINDEGRARADAWMSSLQALPEHQCIPYTSHFLATGGPGNIYLWSETDPISREIVAWKLSWYFGTRTIWVDGRPHPSPSARHDAHGFSTGRWIGDVLHVRTTHLTEGTLWRSGLISSDQATISEYIVRHGDTLRITMILYDPIYFDEPHIRTRSFDYDPNGRIVTEPCEPQVELTRPAGEVPHYLPGTNPYMAEMTAQLGIPLEALRGGAATMYPEFRKQIKDKYTPPAAPPARLRTGQQARCR
jgi:hypothetical protein